MIPGFWTTARSLISAVFIFVVIYVTIADYDTTVPLWKVFVYDAGGWLHEVFYIFVGWHAIMWWTLYWEKKLS